MTTPSPALLPAEEIAAMRDRAAADTSWMYDGERQDHLEQRAADCDRLLAHIAAQERIITAAVEYRAVNTALDNEPPHPHPRERSEPTLAHSLLIRICEQKRAALFAAVDGEKTDG